jgi:tetratricopeptide (TPR) repeat protein
MKLFRLLLVLLLVQPAWGGIFTPKERVDFWRRNYTVLAPDSGVQVAAAHKIFDTVVAAAGARPGVIPQLLVIKETPYAFSLPVSLPDGGIVISADILKRIFAEPGDAESKLAFILGHELAHLYSEDFWHVQFFRLLTLYESGDRSAPDGYRSFLDNREELVKKELFADEQGLLYMTLARYNPAVIVESGRYQNFFDEWNRRIAAPHGGKYEPLVPESARRKAVGARLRHIAEQSILYRLGTLFLIANDYEKAVRLFEEYSLTFPGREVYHNLALSHHFAAVARYTPEDYVSGAMPFKFSFMLDPTERLFHNVTRNSEDGDKRYYDEHLDRAIDYYKRCIQLDPGYLPAYINLATAQLGAGNHYAAIGHLMDVEKAAPPDNRSLQAAIHNNLGIAFQLIGRQEKAGEYFQAAVDQYDSADARYNLARYWHLSGDEGKAGRYWKQFLGEETHGPFARISRDILAMPVTVSDALNVHPVEHIAGLHVNAKTDRLPESPGIADRRTVRLEDGELVYYRFDNGVEAVAQNGRIRLIAAQNGYRGETGRGIGNGAGRETVEQQYGYVGKTFGMPNGEIVNYPRERIGFLFRSGELYSWIIY